MFGNAYQNGPHVQVFDSKVNNDKNQFYKLLYKVQPNTVKRYFDKEIKSYLYEFEGHNARISFPADDHKQLSLHQRYLVLQIHIPIGSAWTMEIGMTDISKTKRRINLTTTQGKQETKFFFMKYPLQQLERGVWVFLGIDVLSFMDAFKGQVFRSLDHIVIGSTCRLRRVFTLKQWNQWEIPKSYWLQGQIQQNLQLIQYGQKKIESPMVMSSPPKHQISRIKETPKKESKIKTNKSQMKKQSTNERSIFKKTPEKPILQVQGGLYARKMVRSQIIPETKPKVRLNTLASNTDKSSIKKSIQKQKSPKSKGPIRKRQFQEDHALMVPAQESDLPQAESHDSLSSELLKQEVIEEDKWSDDQVPKTVVSTPFSEQLNNMSEAFPTTLITKQNNETVVLQKHSEKQLELIYDQMVGCYYHPQTNTYYEINQ